MSLAPAFSPSLATPTPSNNARLQSAWNSVAHELTAIPLILEQTRYAAALKPLTQLPKSAQILEAGCGAGRILRSLDALGYKNLTALEISKSRLDYVHYAGPTSAKLVCTDQLPFADNSFDAVVSAAVIEHVANPSHWLANLARITKPNGIISLTSDTFIWRWLQHLGLYRTLQPLDQAIWPYTLLSYARQANLDLIACGGFVCVPNQQWFFLNQLKRLTNLKRLWMLAWRGPRKHAPSLPTSAPQSNETAAILQSIQKFPHATTKDLPSAIFSYESYYYFRKRDPQQHS